MSSRTFKDAIYGQLARVSHALSSPRRLELLDLLLQSPRTVEALAKEASLSLANTSQHLKVLRAARLLEAEKRGLYVTYRVADPAVVEFFRSLRQLAHGRLAEMDRIVQDFFGAREGLEAVDREELLGRVRRGEVTVLDVRPEEEYRAGHIPGAICVPLHDLERRIGELQSERAVVAYCRGPYCVLAVRAVELLRAHGFKAVRLEDGIPDWRARGFEVVEGPEACTLGS